MTKATPFYTKCPCWKCSYKDEISRVRVLRHTAYVVGAVANQADRQLQDSPEMGSVYRVADLLTIQLRRTVP